MNGVQMMAVNEHGSIFSFLSGLVLGIVIGVITALFLTPMTGGELRQQITSQAQKQYEHAQQVYEVRTEKLQQRRKAPKGEI